MSLLPTAKTLVRSLTDKDHGLQTAWPAPDPAQPSQQWGLPPQSERCASDLQKPEVSQ